MNGYFDELAVLLRERGVPAERVVSTIGELSAFAEEGSGGRGGRHGFRDRRGGGRRGRARRVLRQTR